jgi:hypothetical protein
MMDVSDQRKVFWLGVANGALFAFGAAFLEPSTVLSLFVLKLTGSTICVGVISAIAIGGWLWPQIFMSEILQDKPYKKPFYNIAIAIRLIPWAIIIVLISAGFRGMCLFSSFAILYAIYVLGSGIAMIPFMDIVSKAIPPWRRGSFFGARQLLGGVLSFGAGIYVRNALRSQEVLFPDIFTRFFSIGVAFIGIALLLFSLAPEAPGKTRRRIGFRYHFFRGPRIFRRDRNYRNLFFFRVLASFGGMAGPFYVPNAIKVMGIREDMVGIFMSLMTAGGILSNPIWSRMSDRIGNKIVLEISSILSTIPPLIALLAHLLGGDPRISPILYSFAFALMGISASGRSIGDMNYLLEIAPERERPSYIGFMNTYMIPFSFLPLIGGVIVEAVSFNAILLISMISNLLSALLCSRGLREVREVEEDG